jgi:hypothetical protein
VGQGPPYAEQGSAVVDATLQHMWLRSARRVERRVAKPSAMQRADGQLCRSA